MEPVDPEKFVDPEGTCACGHERDEHDFAQGREACMVSTLNDDGAREWCPCENYDPHQEDDRAA